MSELLAYYNPPTTSTWLGINSDDTYMQYWQRVGKGFQASAGWIIEKLVLKLSRNSNPGVNKYIGVYVLEFDPETYDMDNPLGVQTMLTSDISTDATNYDITFDTPIEITSDMWIGISVEPTNYWNDLPASIRWWADTQAVEGEISPSYNLYALGTSPPGWGDWIVWSSNTKKFFIEVWGTLAVPEKPINPAPADVAEDIRLSYPTISWESGSEEGAPEETYDVYVGPSSGNLSLYVSGWPDTSLTMPTTWLTDDLLYYSSTYYWRVDATNEYGTTEGDVWSFSSIEFTPPRVSYWLLPGGSGSGPYDDPAGVEGTDYEWDGRNCIKTIRRLVGFSNNKCWYGSS